jgi:multidrug resistance efflux pump
MPPLRQSRRDLSSIPAHVSDRSGRMTEPLVLFENASALPRRLPHDAATPARDAARSSNIRQTMVGVGRLAAGFRPAASAQRGAAEPPALQPAETPRQRFRAERTLADTLKFVPQSSACSAPTQTSRSVPPPSLEPAPSNERARARVPATATATELPPSLEPPVSVDARASQAPAGLFRKAAVDAKRADGVELDFSTGVKRKSWSLLLLLASLVGLLFTLAALASVEVTAEAPGVLRAPNGLRPVASALPGSITEVLVRGGDAVEPGQVIARIESTELRASLMNRQRELEIVREDVTQAALHDKLIEAQSTRANQRRRAAIQQRLDLNAERLKQRREQSEDLASLVREGGASRAEGMNAREALQEASELVSSLGNDLAVLDLEISDRTRQGQERESGRRTQLSRAEASVEEARALLAATEIRSPAAGRIESLLVAPGTVVSAGGVLGNVVPNGAPRTIVAFVPSREIAFIQPGAAATVELTSLPVSEFGLGKATVRRVSTDVATAPEVQGALNEAPTGPVVRVELELVDSAASAKMDALLRSGERVKVRLHRRERRLITLLFDFVQRWVQ